MTATPTAPLLEGVSDTGRVGKGPPPVVLSTEAAEILLRLARSVVAATVSGRLKQTDASNLLPADPPADLLAPAAAFVTLFRAGALRGCMGCLSFDLPLWASVASAAASAATRDPRFPPVTDAEVAALSIDVSVLGPLVPLEDPAAFRPGVDGLIVERDGRRGLLLPEVATDHGWGVDEMLGATCWKAGLAEDAWRDGQTRLLTFRTARVSERCTTD